MPHSASTPESFQFTWTLNKFVQSPNWVVHEDFNHGYPHHAEIPSFDTCRFSCFAPVYS